MCKRYESPSLQFLYFYAASDIASLTDTTEEGVAPSAPWNDGELGGWT